MKTSWQKVGSWNNTYNEDHIVGPGVLKLLGLRAGDSVLDLGCGSGWLERKLPKGVSYVGLDLVRGQDVTKPLRLNKQFSHATIILALQNMESPEGAIANAKAHLRPNGSLVIVINHPAFRIPRQSSWGTDEAQGLQYRRENMYLSPLKIPITMHPGEQKSPVTWSFHKPISAYAAMLASGGFWIDGIEEWTSDRASVGRAGKMENRARKEFPLFLTFLCRPKV